MSRESDIIFEGIPDIRENDIVDLWMLIEKKPKRFCIGTIQDESFKFGPRFFQPSVKRALEVWIVKGIFNDFFHTTCEDYEIDYGALLTLNIAQEEIGQSSNPRRPRRMLQFVPLFDRDYPRFILTCF